MYCVYWTKSSTPSSRVFVAGANFELTGSVEIILSYENLASNDALLICESLVLLWPLCSGVGNCEAGKVVRTRYLYRSLLADHTVTTRTKRGRSMQMYSKNCYVKVLRCQRAMAFLSSLVSTSGIRHPWLRCLTMYWHPWIPTKTSLRSCNLLYLKTCAWTSASEVPYIESMYVS